MLNIDKFLEYLCSELNRSPRTVESYRDDLTYFEKFAKGLSDSFSWETVDSDMVRNWMESMMDKGNSAATVERRLSALKTFYRFALTRHYVESDPVYMSLTNAQYNSIMKGYEQTRDRNRHLAEQRRREIYTKLPEYGRLDESVGELSVAQAKLLLNGDDEALTRLRSSLKEISRQKRELLTSAGYPTDYLEPVYDCPDCKDTGYIDSEDGLRKKCHCFHQQELDILYEQSHIRDMIASENFSNLSYEYYQGDDLTHFRKCVDVCRNFVQNFKQDYHNLFFYGTVGTGKSFLSGCIASELLQTGHSVIYFSASGLFDTLARYAFDSRAKEALSGFYEDLYNCDLLIIDDLGTEMTNTFVASQLFSCLNERHLRKNATIISTNLSLEELRDRYSDRVFSRITSHYDLCKLSGPDIRMCKKRMQNTSDN